jgi:hypothetical protein
MRPEDTHALITLAAQRYQDTILCEVLRVAGLTREQAKQLVSSCDQKELMTVVARLMTHYRREHLAVFNGMPMPVPHFKWDVDQIWSETPPAHLLALRAFLVEKIDMSNRGGVSGEVIQAWSARCAVRSRSREALYRDRVKRDLYRILESDLKGEALKQESLDCVISEWVCRNRRDSSIDPLDALPIGFARHATASYALFQEQGSGRRFAVTEGGLDCRESADLDGLKKLAIESIADDGIVFSDPSIESFHGVVMLI